MASIDAPMAPFTVTSADGTSIQAWRAGTGPHRVLLSPGMGTPVLCWKYLFEHFADQVTFVTWDPRGCYGSAKPADPSRIEVVLLDGVNDSDAHAEGVGAWLNGLDVKVNLIPFNPHAGSQFRTPPPERVTAFAQVLRGAGFPVQLRERRGDDVQGACGQLGGGLDPRHRPDRG